MRNCPAPFQHQIEAFEFIKDKDASALFLEQGTGKSKIVIMKIDHLYDLGIIDKVIVISPNAVKDQWVDEQFPEHCTVDNWLGFIWDGCNTKKSKDHFMHVLNSSGLKVFSFNVEAFQSSSVEVYIKMIIENHRTMVVIDESTRIKNARRKTTNKNRGGAVRSNRILDLFHDIRYKVIMTGTPTPRSPFDLWAQYEFLQYNFFGKDFFIFQHHYGILMKQVIQSRHITSLLDEKTYNKIKNTLKKIPKLDNSTIEAIALQYNIKTSDIIRINNMAIFSEYKNLDELKKIISTITFFKKKNECLDLPEKLYSKLYADMGKQQAIVYNELKKNMLAQYKGHELSVLNKVVITLRLQMITGGLFPYSEVDIVIGEDGEESFVGTYKYDTIDDNGKLTVLLDDLDDVPEDTYIIIWARFIGEIDLIHKALVDKGYSAEKYYGGVDIEVINRFKRKEFRILVANPLKGGEGLNLQVATLHYFYSNSYRADSRLQAEDRSHRIGQINNVYYKDIICKCTIDENIYGVLKRKENLIDYFRTRDIEDVI